MTTPTTPTTPAANSAPMSETPRTDANTYEAIDHLGKVVPVNVARQLERELAQAIAEKERVERWAEQRLEMQQMANANCEHANRELTAERERADALAGALKSIASQKQSDEMSATEWDVADFETGYDMCIEEARRHYRAHSAAREDAK